MNTKFINEVADYIEQLPPGAFDMRDSGKLGIMNSLPHPMPPPASLSQPACIATYAALLTGNRELRSITWTAPDLFSVAEAAFEVERGSMTDLFFPVGVVGVGQIHPREAAMVLRHLAATGLVDWSVAGLDMDSNGLRGTLRFLWELLQPRTPGHVAKAQEVVQ